MGWGGVSQGPKGQGWGEKVFSIMWGGARMGQDKKPYGAGMKTPSFDPVQPYCHPYQ